jgi:serine/threonine protein kinase
MAEKPYPGENYVTLPRFTLHKTIRSTDPQNPLDHARLKVISRIPDNKLFVCKSHKTSELRNEHDVFSRVDNCCPKIIEWYYYFHDELDPRSSHLILEYLHHGSLKQIYLEHREQNQRISESNIWILLDDILEALRFLSTGKLAEEDDSLPWAHPFVHLDGKPDNIMLSNDGVHWKLIDFGPSRVCRLGSETTFRGGTRGFLAPEWPWVDGNKPDVWMLGSCVHQVTTDEVPAVLAETQLHYALDVKRG